MIAPQEELNWLRRNCVSYFFWLEVISRRWRVMLQLYYCSIDIGLAILICNTYFIILLSDGCALFGGSGAINILSKLLFVIFFFRKLVHPYQFATLVIGHCRAYYIV